MCAVETISSVTQAHTHKYTPLDPLPLEVEAMNRVGYNANAGSGGAEVWPFD